MQNSNFFVRPDASQTRPLQSYTPQPLNPFGNTLQSRTSASNPFSSGPSFNPPSSSFPQVSNSFPPVSNSFPMGNPGTTAFPMNNPIANSAPTGNPSVSRNPFSANSAFPVSSQGMYSSSQPANNPFSSNFTGNMPQYSLPNTFTGNLPSTTGHPFSNNYPLNSGHPTALSFPNFPQNLSSPSMQFEEPGSWKHKKIETLNENYKNFFYNTQKEFDKIDEALKQSQSTLKSFDEIKGKVAEKSANVLSYTRKVLALQKRIQITLDLKLTFEQKVARYIKDFIRICDHYNPSDNYHQITAPADFLQDFLALSDSRLADMEDHISSIEEMIKNECEVESLQMLVQVISMMQEKFKVVSAVTFECHLKVAKMHAEFSSQYKEISSFTPYNDSGNRINMLKENTPPSLVKSSNIKDVISGRLYFSNR